MDNILVDKNITDMDIEDSVRQSYLDYSMSVIVGRAIPDARDGLKPVHRRILYAMKELNLDFNKSYKKSARVVGDVIGKYHPHGDMAVYDALVRMAQDFSMRYPLIDGQGNFGSMDGDSPAAMRYTEVRLSKIAEEMLKDLEKNTVDFMLNYDDSLNEPIVFPSYIPNLLINGTSGIAVGFTTSVPPHNLSEVIDAILFYLDKDGNIEIDDLFKFIKGPDFPTGGICFDKHNIYEAYKNGYGKIRVKANTRIEKGKRGESIVIYELPYQVNKALLVQSIAELVKNKRIDGISDIRDESNKDGVRVVIDLKRDEQSNVILSNLYKYTNMETTFSINMLVLVNNVPKLLDLKGIISVFVDHRIDVLNRSTTFLLLKAKDKAHILEGILKALDNIDEIVSMIKNSKDTQDAKLGLKRKFLFSNKQCQAILDMKLSRLVNLERKKLVGEYEQIIKDIAYYESILSNKSILKNVIKDELLKIKKIYGDERRTLIQDRMETVDLEDMIKNEELVVVFTKKGYIKTTIEENYSIQKKGGKGKFVSTFSDGDSIANVFVANSLEELLCFSDFGRVYKLKTYSIPKLQPSAKGKPIVNLLRLKDNEYIKNIISPTDNKYLFFVTSKAKVKKSSKDEFRNFNLYGKIAIRLNHNDKLINVFGVDDTDDVVLITKNGMLIRFHTADIRLMGRGAAGVIGMKLTRDDSVVDAHKFNQNDNGAMLIITAKGIGKLISIANIRTIKRGGKGVKAIRLQSNYVVGSLNINDLNDVIISTKKGKMIRFNPKNIRVMSRTARGMKLIDVDINDEVVSISKIESKEENSDT